MVIITIALFRDINIHLIKLFKYSTVNEKII
jgi:hypothetical protein